MEGSLVTLNPVDIGLLLPGAVAVCLLAVSALVSGAETSFFSLTPHDIRDIKAHPEKSSNDAILRLLGDVDQLLATILVVNNLVNICIVILAARIINLLFTFGSAGMRFLFESVIATFLLLLFGEIIPKVFAQSRPLRFARTVARPILLMRWLMRPFAYILIRTSSTISEHAARRNEISLDELADAVDLIRFSEDQFVCWDVLPDDDGVRTLCTPCVYEQYGYRVPVDNSTCVVANALLDLCEATGDRLAFAKAKALADNLTVVQNALDGLIPTSLDVREGAKNRIRGFWVNCTYASILTLLRMAELTGETAGFPADVSHAR